MVIFSILPLRARKSNMFKEINQEKKQRNYTINEAKKIKSNYSTRGNREKSNIAIALLEK